MAVVSTHFFVGEGAADAEEGGSAEDDAAMASVPKPLWSVGYQDGGGEGEAWGGDNLPGTATVVRQTEDEIDAHEAIAEATLCFCLATRAMDQFFAAKTAHDVGEDSAKDEQP